jgi:hypothetical protein
MGAHKTYKTHLILYKTIFSLFLLNDFSPRHPRRTWSHRDHVTTLAAAKSGARLIRGRGYFFVRYPVSILTLNVKEQNLLHPHRPNIEFQPACYFVNFAFVFP